MRITTLPSSTELMIDSRAKQSERQRFAHALRAAANLVEERELRLTERMSFVHIEFQVTEEE